MARDKSRWYDGHNRRPAGTPMRVIRWRHLRRRMAQQLRGTAGPVRRVVA